MKRSVLAVLILILSASLGARADTLPAQGASNDDRSSAAKIEALPAAASLVFEGSTSEQGEDTSCGAGGTLWYTYKSPVDQVVRVATGEAFGMGGSAAVHVYRKDRAVLTSLGCGDPSFGWEASAGTHYLIQVAATPLSRDINLFMAPVPADGTPAGWSATPGTAINVLAPPTFKQVVPMFSWPGSVEHEPSCADAIDAFWYTAQQPALTVGSVHMDALGAAYIAVYTRTADGSFVEKSCATVSSGVENADLRLVDVTETTYYIEFGARWPNPDEDPELVSPADYGYIEINV